ncbi:MAG: hypothetical protein R2769_12920 [Saprospiraceae bacterium]
MGIWTQDALRINSSIVARTSSLEIVNLPGPEDLHILWIQFYTIVPAILPKANGQWLKANGQKPTANS